MGIVVSGSMSSLFKKTSGDIEIFCQNVTQEIFFGELYAASQRAVLNISVVADEDCEIILDRQQLADYLCIDRAAMSTEISKLQKGAL